MRLLLLWLCCLPLSAAELIFGITNAHKMPWVRLVNDEAHGGLLVEIGALMAQALHHDVRFVMVPRKRVEVMLQQHDIDLICNYRPQWFDEPAKVFWSGPVLRQGDVVVSLRARGLAVTAADLANKKISMTLGYHYPELQKLMANHPFSRIDVKYEELTIQQVMTGLADYAVLNSYMFDWYVHEHPQHPFTTATFVSTFDFECALSKRAPVTESELQAATKRLRAQGQFAALAEKYGLTIPP